MGADQRDHGAWERVQELAEKLSSPHADKVFVAKDYTKADLRRDLLASIPKMPPQS